MEKSVGWRMKEFVMMGHARDVPRVAVVDHVAGFATSIGSVAQTRVELTQYGHGRRAACLGSLRE
jgi:hypothetical protein